MLDDLALGTLVISATVIIHTASLIGLSRALVAFVRWGKLHAHPVGKSGTMVLTVLGLFLALSVEVWLWAGIYLALGVMPSFSDALYFSTVTFSTLGYGDIVLPHEWRILGSLEAVDGFLLIGWSTAYLVSASTRYGPFRIGEHF